MTREAATAREVFAGALVELDPARRVCDAARGLDWRGERVIPIAIGKAAGAALSGLAEAVGERLAPGVCVVPAGADPAARQPAGWPWDTAIAYGSHPAPDQRSVDAARAVLAAVRAAPADAEIAALISGGASSLVALPAPGLAFADKVSAVTAVQRAGADIAELNTVRRHLSAIKGGRLAAASVVPVTTLVLSDVVGDDPATVGSGPTQPDPTTYRHAWEVIAARVGWGSVAPSVRRHLEAGIAGAFADTAPGPRPDDRVVLAASIDALVDAAVIAARGVGVGARVFARGLVGDVREVARRVAAHARRVHSAGRAGGAPRCWIAAGEPTVALPPAAGTGGRAQQLALLVARDIAGADGVAVLAAGTDGVDGNSHAAGAVVTGATWSAIRVAGHDPDRALVACDATAALAAVDALIVTGPTGVNHADLIAVVG